jgi:hypothetical protein
MNLTFSVLSSVPVERAISSRKSLKKSLPETLPLWIPFTPALLAELAAVIPRSEIVLEPKIEFSLDDLNAATHFVPVCRKMMKTTEADEDWNKEKHLKPRKTGAWRPIRMLESLDLSSGKLPVDAIAGVFEGLEEVEAIVVK